jgi:4'-phosphopantetheinyl transferase EntD
MGRWAKNQHASLSAYGLLPHPTPAIVNIYLGLLDPRLAVAAMAIERVPFELFPEEEAFVLDAVEKRCREFSSGRVLARRAMAELGVPPAAIPRGNDRLPIWPLGLIGSIAHTDSYCAAAIGRREDGLRSVGLDLEPAEPLPSDLLDRVTLSEERAWLASFNDVERGIYARALFSAKECAFKCQYPLTRTMLDFHDFAVVLDREQERFTATLRRDAPPFENGSVFHGRFRIGADLIACAMSIAEEDV